MAQPERPDEHSSESDELARALRRPRGASGLVARTGPDPETGTAWKPPADELAGERRAIHIEGDVISAGSVSVKWYSNHIDDILVAFLEVIRRARGDAESEVTGFRRIDIDVLAQHLDMSGEDVLDALSALLGATKTRSASMAHLYTTGAGVIPPGAEEQEAPAEPVTRLAALLNEGS